jgi:hypothetical protein
MLAPPSRGDCRPWSLWPPTLARRREIAFVMTNTCGRRHTQPEAAGQGGQSHLDGCTRSFGGRGVPPAG